MQCGQSQGKWQSQQFLWEAQWGTIGDELKPCSEVSVRATVWGIHAVKGECIQTIHYAHKTNKVPYGLIAEEGQRGKKYKALKVVAGQENSFVWEERKGVRKNDKGRKQTTLRSHLPTLPLPKTDPRVLQDGLPFLRPCTPTFYDCLSLILPSRFQIKLAIFYIILTSPAFPKHNP